MLVRGQVQTNKYDRRQAIGANESRPAKNRIMGTDGLQGHQKSDREVAEAHPESRTSFLQLSCNFIPPQSGPGPAWKRFLCTDALRGALKKLQKSSRNTSQIQNMISATVLQLDSATKRARTGLEEASCHRWLPGVIKKLQKNAETHP